MQTPYLQFVIQQTLLHFDKYFFYILMKTWLHYHQDLIYNIIINNSLHCGEDFVTHPIAIINFALHTFTEK